MVFGLRKHCSHSLQNTKTLVSNDEFHAVQTTATHSLEEADPAGLSSFMPSAALRTSRYPSSLTAIAARMVAFFKLFAPVAAQIDPIHIDIRITPALQRTILPIFNVGIRFLVYLTDGRGRELAAPESLGDALHTPDRYPCQVHLNEGLFHTALPAAITINDSWLKRDSLEFGPLQDDISRGGSETTVVVAAAVALILLIALVPSLLESVFELRLPATR